MDFTVQRNDIAEMSVDVIVLPANSRLREGLGASRAIFEKAGRIELRTACGVQLREARRRKLKLVPGVSVPTRAFELPSSVILHTIVPKWVDGEHNEYDQLCMAYVSALRLTDQMGFESLALPLLASGNNGFDTDIAIEVATKSIEQYEPYNKLSQVILVTFGSYATQKMKDAGYEVEEYIDELYVLDQGMKQHKIVPVWYAAQKLAAGLLNNAISDVYDWLCDEDNQRFVYEKAKQVMLQVAMDKMADVVDLGGRQKALQEGE